MAANSDYLEAAILTYFFRPGEAAPTRPTAVYVALSTADPTEDGSGLAEPTFTGYARQEATFGAVSAGSGTESKIANTVALEFGDPDDDDTATHFAIFDAATNGNMLRYGALGAPVTWQAAVNDPVSIPIGALVLTED